MVAGFEVEDTCSFYPTKLLPVSRPSIDIETRNISFVIVLPKVNLCVCVCALSISTDPAHPWIRQSIPKILVVKLMLL